MNLLDEDGVLRITYEKDTGIQVHEWLDYNPEYREPLIFKLLDRIYELLIDYPVEKILVKAEHARGTFSPEVQAYIRDVQFPRLVNDTPVRFVVTIQPPEKLAKSGTKLWEAQLKQHAKVITHDVQSEYEAREWLDMVGQC